MELPKLTKKAAEEAEKCAKEELERIKKEEPRIIQLTLENVEVISIDIQDVNYMRLTNVHEDHVIGVRDSFVETFIECSKACIELSSKANKKYDAFSEFNSFERLIKYPDIVSIDYINGYNECLKRIFVPWNDAYEEENMYQTTTINENGDLVITIEPKQR